MSPVHACMHVFKLEACVSIGEWDEWGNGMDQDFTVHQ
jgi:hypothetical protein